MHSLPGASGDRTMIREVFQNLLANAIKFTRGREHPQIEVGSYEEGNENVYFVCDNGIGFDMRFAAKLQGVPKITHRRRVRGHRRGPGNSSKRDLEAWRPRLGRRQARRRRDVLLLAPQIESFISKTRKCRLRVLLLRLKWLAPYG